MGLLFDTAAGYFKTDEWTFQRQVDDEALLVGTSGRSGVWTCLLVANEADRTVFFFSICPNTIPPERREKVSEYLMRVNQLVWAGHFFMDFDDGEIQYKTELLAASVENITERIEELVRRNISVMDRYLPGILLVLYSDKTPAEVVSEILTGRAVDKRYVNN